MTKIVLATGNQGKVAELGKMLSPLGAEIIAQSEFKLDSVAETGTTFVENAIIKARHAAKQTGLPAIADDSGLEVDFLNGAPGIYSSRYAGANASDQDNVNKLLRALADVEQSKRTARFQCVLVFMQHADDPTPIIAQGSWEGCISEQIRGEHGFGYDPIFFQPQLKLTAAELSAEQKASLSHRGKALRSLLAQMENLSPAALQHTNKAN